jgi:Tat protein secretion system quality control protein TatD with DNase activity
MLKIHVSSWTGTAEDMLSLLQTFPENVWFGLDSTVTFAKACRVQECAFDVPLHRILLETGANSIPSIVTKSMGRHAFSSSALIPFIAQAIAEIKKVDAATVARAAATNTRKLYPTLLNVVSSHDTVPIAKNDS